MRQRAARRRLMDFGTASIQESREFSLYRFCCPERRTNFARSAALLGDMELEIFVLRRLLIEDVAQAARRKSEQSCDIRERRGAFK